MADQLSKVSLCEPVAKYSSPARVGHPRHREQVLCLRQIHGSGAETRERRSRPHDYCRWAPREEGRSTREFVLRNRDSGLENLKSTTLNRATTKHFIPIWSA